MKGFFGKLVWLLAFVTGGVLFNYGRDAWLQHQAIETAQASMEQMKKDGIAARPDLPASEAHAEAAKQQSAKRLDATNSPQEKVTVAADQFMGFYYINVKGRYDYCLEQGVDITPFVTEFKSAHADEYRIATDAHKGHQAEVEQLVAKMAPQFRAVIDQGIQDAARRDHMSIKDECVSLAGNAKEYAKFINLRKINPSLYAALHGK